MAISFDEWRAAKQQGKQATDKPDFAAWRLKKQQEKEDAKKLSVTGTASGSVGIPASVGAPPPSAKNRFATPDTIKLGDTQVPATGTLGAIADVATGISNLGESVPASYREGARTSKASVAKQELDFTGRVTLEPERPTKYERGGILVSPATPGKFLTGKEAEDYVASLEAPTEDTRTMEEYRQEAGIFGRAATSTLSQPEQALSVLGGVAGAAVGMPGVGAALGSAPAIISAYNAEYLRNRQLGLGPEESRANALTKLPVEALTEFVGGRFGAKSLPAGVVLGGAEEGAAELGGMGVDLASQQLSTQPEAYEQKLPKTFAEGLTQVTESALGGMMGAGIMAGAPRALGAGMSAAREMLAKAGGISDGRTDTAQPKAKTPSYVDAPSSITPTNIDTVEPQTTTGITNIEEAKRDSVNPAGDSKKREIPAKEDTLPSAPLSAVQLTPADAGTIIDTRLSSLREASQRNRLDEGTVKTLQREDEELRLTLQEDEKRKAAGILQTPERPYLSDNARNLISQKRAEVRERLEQHRAAVGYGNELRDLETRLSKLGESDSDFVALADSIVRGQGASVSRAQQQMAPVAAQNQSQTLPATPVAPTAVEAPVASQGAATSVPATTPTVTSGIAAQAVQSPVTSAQVPQVSNTKPKRTKTPTPKTISEGDALAQAFTELQQKSVSDPAFQKQVTDNPSLMRQMATKRAAEIVAASKAPKAVEAPAVPETPTLDMATPAPNKPRYESKDAFLTELYSGAGDKEATEAKKIADNIVVYDGDTDLAGIDPEVAATVQEAVQKQGATGARPKAFQYKGKVYFNMEGVRPGEAKSTFLHEARVHLAAKAEPARVSALASRVVALAKAGDATAQAAAKTVAKEYPGVTQSAKEGSESAKDLSREELLADFAQRVYDRVKSGQGVSGTIKRLYSDVMSYLRDLYTTAAKKLFGERFALNITDVDILDAVRYGRTAAGFKGEAKPTALAEAAQKAKDETPAMSLTSNTIKPDTGGVELPEGSKVSRGVNKLLDKGTALLRPRGTASREAQLMGERAVGTSNELRIAGEVLVKELVSELNTVLAGETARKQAMYRYDIGQYLAGKKELSPNIPKNIRDTVDAMRLMLDNNTMKLIALGAVKPQDIRKLINNMGRWIHRDFEVFHHKPGDVLNPGEYKKLVQAMAEDGNDIVASVLPDVMAELKLPDAAVINKLGEIASKKGGKKAWRQESVNAVRAATGTAPLTKETKKSNKEIRKQAERYLRNMAGKWGIGSGTPLDGPDGIVARLTALSTNGTADLEAAAKRYANLMLDPKANPYQESLEIPDRKSPLGIDDTALSKVRKDVPEWLRTIWGQFKDPVPMFLVSLDNQADIIAKFTALAEYKQKGLKNGNVVPNTAGTADFNMRKKGYHLLQKPDDPLYYGPLDNTYVKMRDLPMLEVAALKDFVARQIRQSMGNKWLRPLAAAGQPVKMMLVAGDYTSQMVQAASALVFYSGLNFSKIPAAFSGARYTSFGGTSLGKAIANKRLDADVKAWIAQGMLVNNALAGDARRKLVEFVQQPGEQFLPKVKLRMRQAGRVYGKATDAISRVMALPDEMAKIMMAYGRMDDLAAIYPDKSRDELREIAGDETMGTTPTLNREAPLARYLANSGVVNPFATFLASNFRNFYNHFAMAAKYGKMPGKAAKMYAAKELMIVSLKAGAIHATMQGLIWSGTAAAAAAQYAFAGMMQALGADDDEQEEIKKQAEAGAKEQKEHYQALRALVPDWQLGEVSITREMEPDVYVYAAIQRFDPSPVGSIMSAVGRDDWSEVAEIVKSNLFSEAPVLKGLATMVMYAPTTVGEAATETMLGDDYQSNARDSEEVRKFWQEGAKEVALAYTPGSFKRVYKQLTSDEEYTALETVIMNTGGTVGVLDVKKRVAEVVGDYKALLDANKRALGKAASTKDGLLSGTSLDLAGDLTTRAMAWKSARAKVAAVQSLGKSDEWIEEAIDANPYTSSMSKDEVESLLDGVFRVPDYQEWLDKQYEMDIADPKNARRLDEVEEQYARYGKELQQFEEGLADLLKGMEVEYY